MRALVLVGAAALLSCRGSSRETPDAEAQVLGDRGGGATVDTGAHAAELDVVEKARLEHERDRAAYIALAPAVSPAASGSSGVPFWRTCPPHYGVAEADAGVFYCGKVCGYGVAPLGTLVSGGVPSLCDGDEAVDASTSCCGRHRCDRYSIKQSPLPGDGPMPSVCSPDEKKSGSPNRPAR